MSTTTEYQLRDMTEADLPIVFEWRNFERVRKYMYTSHSISWEEHQAWFARVQYSTEKKYLICEYKAKPIGQVNFVDLDQQNHHAFWGFYVGDTSAPRGSGSVMGFLGIEYAFTELDLRKLYGEALANNISSVNYHRRLGFKEEGRFIQHIQSCGEYQDIVRFALFQPEWLNYRENLKNRLLGGQQ